MAPGETEGRGGGRRPPLWALLRRDPGHAPELVVLHALPWMAPSVRAWAAAERTGAWGDLEERSRRVVRESVRTARWAGAVTGSSFYLGMGPALAAIYCQQLAMVLRIAALHGLDPADPVRAAEVTLIQGRQPTLEAAVEATARAGSPDPGRKRATVRSLLRDVPAMIGLQLRRLRSPVDAVITIVEVVAFAIPVLSIPVWAIANVRATRKLGRAATRFYGAGVRGDGAVRSVPTPAAPTVRRRWCTSIGLVALMVVLGAIAAVLPLGHHLHALPFGGRVLADLALLGSFAGLIRVVRPRPLRPPGGGP